MDSLTPAFNLARTISSSGSGFLRTSPPLEAVPGAVPAPASAYQDARGRRHTVDAGEELSPALELAESSAQRAHKRASCNTMAEAREAADARTSPLGRAVGRLGRSHTTHRAKGSSSRFNRLSGEGDVGGEYSTQLNETELS
jgi:hypothetical protein